MRLDDALMFDGEMGCEESRHAVSAVRRYRDADVRDNTTTGQENRNCDDLICHRSVWGESHTTQTEVGSKRVAGGRRDTATPERSRRFAAKP